MIVPAVMFIEMAAASLSKVPAWVREHQRNELHSMGDARVQAIGASGLTDDLMVGYELGLQTARKYLAGNPAAVLAKVEL